jgi:hypothetical protein
MTMADGIVFNDTLLPDAPGIEAGDATVDAQVDAIDALPFDAAFDPASDGIVDADEPDVNAEADVYTDPAIDPAPDPVADPAADPLPDPAPDPEPVPEVAEEELVVDTAPVDTAPVEPGLAKQNAIYPHTSGELFVWNATATPPTKVGDFDFPDDGLDHTMTDMAIDYDGRLYGVTFGGLYRCMADTAKCNNLASFDEYFNGMTIVPEGTIQAAKETIVAISNAGGWYRVEVVGTQAVLTHQGDYGGGYSSAGDAYSIKGVGTWAAVNNGLGGTLLVQVDPVTGGVIKELGTIPGENVYGLAGYSDKVFAFDSSGTIYQGNTTGAASFQVFLETGYAWYGAAVSTREH